MALKDKTLYVCAKCDAQSPKWNGVCFECGAFGTLEPQGAMASAPRGAAAAKPVSLTAFSDIVTDGDERLETGIRELDRVLGGGIVRGAVTLLGGEPGIGKSTLAVALCAAVASRGKDVVYVSGEESAAQVRLRSRRMGVPDDRLSFSAVTDVDAIAATLERDRPALLIVDSIQTVRCGDIPSESGTMAQVRVSAQRLASAAKSSGVPLLLIGHVTKDGHVAGPKTLEHLVDTVLSFEGERTGSLRLLRGLKNRFGATDETGIFAMTERGLEEVRNPSAFLLEERSADMPGSAICCMLEGTRPVLVEIQALTRKTSFGTPTRRASGFDQARLDMLVAVLGRRGGLDLTDHDIYLNVVGGLKAKEPAADLPVVLAVASAARNISLADGMVAWGEIGLGGEVRSVVSHERRCAEASELGMRTAIAARAKGGRGTTSIAVSEAKTILQALKAAGIA